MILKFTKMQALGNDFVVIDAVNQSVNLSAETIRFLANRHLGVGCDQVLLLTSAAHSSADFGYRIFNADGGQAYQCGNGARCMALFIRDQKLSVKKTVVLETTRDLLSVTCLDNGDVRADIAKPNFDPVSLPFLPEQYDLDLISFEPVSVGNPHCVIFSQDKTTAQMLAIGEDLNAHPAFPDGVNVGFAKVVSPTQISLQVYERGAGLTLACGSGACAAVAVGRRLRYLESAVLVDQPGGRLMVVWEAPDAMIQLQGSANTVFQGEIDLSKSWVA